MLIFAPKKSTDGGDEASWKGAAGKYLENRTSLVQLSEFMEAPLKRLRSKLLGVICPDDFSEISMMAENLVTRNSLAVNR